ncbi:P-loop NTPase fold protein [Amycolatopsis sp. NPDC003861]
MPEGELADEIAAIAKDVFERQEFEHYRDHRDDILKRLLAENIDDVRRATAPDRTAHKDALETANNAVSIRRTKSNLWLTLLALLTVLAIFIAGYFSGTDAEAITTIFGVDPKQSWIAHNTYLIAFTGWLVVGLLIIVAISQIFRRKAAIKSAMQPADTAAGVLDRSMSAAVQEAISTAINSELGPRGIVAFPTHAPRLVELDVTQVRQSATANYVREFIREHESSAIGLAGTRGSGKSTVMQALLGDADADEPVVITPSPVRYDPGEFIRLLLTNVARAIAGRRSRAARNHLRVALQRATIGKQLIILGSALGISVLPELLRGSSSFSTTSSILTTRILAGANLFQLIAIALLIFVGIVQFAKVLVRVDTNSMQPHVRQALAVLRELRWETERATSNKNTLKVQSVYESSGENSLKLKSRAPSRSDLVDSLRELLKLFASHSEDKRMVLCIDELDKLGDPADLVDIVNELKDLFHIEKVHFLVTVSTDALDSFERRGLAGRDAFDSAFDTVVHTRRLELDESLDIVRARATGFPPIVAMLCHAWSGGLPRDLLRTARAAVELQRRNSKAPLSIDTIFATVVLDDLEAAVRASMRTLDFDDDQLEDLWGMQRGLVAARDQSADFDRIRKDLPGPDHFKTPSLRALLSKVKLGLSLLRVAKVARSLPNYWQEDGVALRSMRKAAAEHATAIAALSEPALVHEAAVTAAVREFDSAALVSAAAPTAYATADPPLPDASTNGASASSSRG